VGAADDGGPARGSILKRSLKVMIYSIVALLLVFVVLFFWASSGDDYSSETTDGLLITRPEAAAAPEQGDGFTVMAFNIAYGRGPGTDDSGPWPRERFIAHLDGIIAQIRDSGADLAALQEVDLGASRSHGIDQAAYLLDGLGWGWASCAVTWEKNYVPWPYWPPSRHFGRMKSGLCLLSRFPITASRRIPLPQPDDPFWRVRFYFQRAIQESTVQIHGEAWQVLNVHLEAYGLGNRHAQADLLADLLKRGTGERTLVLGDFNALPETAPKRHAFADDDQDDYRGDETLRRAFSGLDFAEVLKEDHNAFTFPADAPNRRLDYIYHGPAVTSAEARVLSPPPGPFSDHLPVLARLRYPEGQ